MKERILCAAIWYNDDEVHPNQEIYGIETGFVIGGHRHHNIIGVMPTNSKILGKDKSYRTVQGFITSTGRFVDRMKAAQVAYECGQIKQETTRLFSEDLY